MYSLSKRGPKILKAAILCTSFLISSDLVAKEGMWVPATIKSRENDMVLQGLQIPVERLYNEDGTGLNNAVIIFGKGCTGEVISSRGLILTNHHCGYGTVQGLSSIENDYFANGFWAMNLQGEIPCGGLTVTFIRKMDNVTDKILTGIPDKLSGPGRDSVIAIRIKNLEKGYKATTKLDVAIQPYFNGNQYWATLTETFKDIRLVGFPPNGIGQFGGDTDNWMWPRHTGDFSMFRVYAGKDNKPAPYDKKNKPYRTQQYFTINAGGYKEGDFTMVYGMPGTTQEYISSYQLNQAYGISDPIRIEARTKKLDAWTKSMSPSREVFLKYTSKRAGVANGWKKWQGEVRGLKMNNVINQKLEAEKNFQFWASRNDSLPYSNVLIQMERAASSVNDIIATNEYINEAVLGVELIQQGGTLDKMLLCFRSKMTETQLQDTLKKMVNNGFYKNYDAATDKQIFKTLMPLYLERSPLELPAYYRNKNTVFKNNTDAWAEEVFNGSIATDHDKLERFAASARKFDSVHIMSDPAWQLYHSIAEYRSKKIAPALSRYNTKMATLNRLYMKGQMRREHNKQFYPDANFTLRIAYGQVKGINSEGSKGYSYQTDLDGAIAKDNPAVEEFKVPQKLKDLYAKKDYGRWAVNGTVPLAFIADNHTSGGNSGSPVLNAKGQLIGTNFDRVWEGTMSDFYFDPAMCRNISLDVRYTLFIIEKMGGAKWLLNEMKIVKK